MARILLDTCVWGGVLPELIGREHDTIWTGSWEKDPGDTAILGFAPEERRILVTLDKDFGELAVVKGFLHTGIVRLSGFRVAQMADAIDHVISTYESELETGAIVTVNPDRIRIRPR